MDNEFERILAESFNNYNNNVPISISEANNVNDIFVGNEVKTECIICYEENIPKKHQVTLNCKHQFCKDCFKGCLKSAPVYRDLPRCALCREDISAITIHDASVKSEFDEYLSV